MSTRTILSGTIGFLAGAAATLVLVNLYGGWLDALHHSPVDHPQMEVAFYASLLLCPFGGLLAAWLAIRMTGKRSG